MTNQFNDNTSIILFDGVCNLCSNAVQFVIKRDSSKKFQYASLQGVYGQALLAQKGLSLTDLNSVLLYQNGVLYARSTAALRVAKELAGGWKILYVCIIIPVFFRDAIYNFIASHRYRWFGKKETCWIPSITLKNLFLD